MPRWLEFTTSDMVGDLLFGKLLNGLDSSDYYPSVYLIFAGVKAGTQIVALVGLYN